MSYEAIEVTKLAGTIGAEIGGVDLKRLSNQAWSEIHRAFLENIVIVFRGQDLSLDDLMAVGRRFGEPSDYPFVKGVDGYPQIVEIVKEAHETKNFGGAWHSDTTYLPRPPAATLLYAKETPSYGGDTLFANQYLAYEALSPGMKAMLDRLNGVYSASLKRGGGRANRHNDIRGMKVTGTANANSYEAVHPAGAHPSRDRPQGALCQPQPHDPLRGHDGGGERPARRLPLRARSAAGIHLPRPLGAGHAHRVGQSLRQAFRGERLYGAAPGDAAAHGRAGSAGMRRSKG